MTSTRLEHLLERAEHAPLTWNPINGGHRGIVCFEDDKTYDLGADPSGVRFQEISERMITGCYYPADAIRVHGRFLVEGRELQVGDRLLQLAPLFGRFGGPLLPAAVEIFVADRTSGHCRIGYITTAFHFGRGIWSAILTIQSGRLSLRVHSTTSPRSWLFWTGLPYARWLQLRARRRAVEEFVKL